MRRQVFLGGERKRNRKRKEKREFKEKSDASTTGGDL